MRTMTPQTTSLTIDPQPFIQAYIKKTPKLLVTGLCEENSPVTPHKGPVTRKMFPFDDVIMDRWSANTVKSVESTTLITPL